MKGDVGWRMFMEDTFIAEDALGKNDTVSLFAIFDGHGGTTSLK
jgi:serine/threonine protein phosphatase PrpC